jgi:hypothetical protein
MKNNPVAPFFIGFLFFVIARTVFGLFFEEPNDQEQILLYKLPTVAFVDVRGDTADALYADSVLAKIRADSVFDIRAIVWSGEGWYHAAGHQSGGIYVTETPRQAEQSVFDMCRDDTALRAHNQTVLIIAPDKRSRADLVSFIDKTQKNGAYIFFAHGRNEPVFLPEEH